MHVHSSSLPLVTDRSVTTRPIFQMHCGVPDLADHGKSSIELIARFFHCLWGCVVIAQRIQEFSERIHRIDKGVCMNERHFATVRPRGYAQLCFLVQSTAVTFQSVSVEFSKIQVT